MKKIPLIILIAITFCFSIQAQANAKRSALPANLAQMKGEYPDKFLKKETVKSRLKVLLGKNYSAFLDSFETQSQFEKKGNFLFSRGCLIHACGHLESAIAIDLVNKTIHVGIFRENEKNKVFNENNLTTPDSITTWFKNLTKK